MKKSKLIEPIYHIDIAGKRYSLERLENLEVIHNGSRVIAHIAHTSKNYDTLVDIVEQNNHCVHVRSWYGYQTIVIDMGVRYFITMED